MITIKEVDETDLKNLLTLWNNGEVMRFVGFPTGLHRTLNDAQKWLDAVKQKRPQLNRYAIYDEKLGFCGETDYTKRGDQCDMDIKLLPYAQGRGIALQALSYAIEQAFENGAETVQVSPWDVNNKSIILYQKLGFKKTHCEIPLKNKLSAKELDILFHPPGKKVIYMTLNKKIWYKREQK